MDILLETERLYLRRVVATDLHRLYELDNDPEVMRFINGGVPVSLASVERDLLPSFLNYDPDVPLFGFWALMAKRDDAFMGWLSLRLCDKDEAVLGYRLLQCYWGEGLVTEGARGLVAKAFTDSELERIVATTYEHNLASRRVMEKLGMRLVKRYRMTTEELAQSDTHLVDSLELWEGDDVEYALSKEEWRTMATEPEQRFDFCVEAIDLAAVRIEGERLVLLSLDERFTEAIFHEFTAEVTSFMFPKPAEVIDETRDFIRSSVASYADKNNLVLAIVAKDEEDFLGCCGLHGSNDASKPELGIWLKKSAHGQGLGREAIDTLMRWAEVNIRLEAFIYPVDRRNTPSRKIPESFHSMISHEKKVINMAGELLDLLFYRILVPVVEV